MDRIYKIINIDNSRSHRNGLLPFVRYGDFSEIEFVDSASTNGNYGQFVCDFAVFSGDVETKRLKYLDILSRYHFIQESLRDAVYVKCYKCDEGYRLVEKFDEIEYTPRYKFEPKDFRFFTKGKFGYYFTEPYDYSVAKSKEEKTEEEQKLIECVESASNLKDGVLYVLIPNYEEIIEINKWWNNWWEENGGSPFDGRTENPNFPFCDDVEKYILGIIEVVGDKDKIITGSKVPSYIYYVNHKEHLEWFNSHKDEYEKYSENTPSDKEWVINEWNEHGGNNFHEFLTSQELHWQTSPLNGDVRYVPPTIDIETIINTEEDYETLYNVYEYSVSENEIVKVVRPYSGATSEGVGSVLTPTYVNLSGSNVYCESKLDSLIHHSAINVSDGIFGIYEEFFEREGDEYEAVGQMFECTFKREWSSQEEVYGYSSSITYTYRNEEDKSGIVRFGITELDGTQNEVAPETDGERIMDVMIINTKTTRTEATPKEEKDSLERITKITYRWSAITEYEYTWWDCVTAKNPEEKECADGEDVGPGNTDKYRNVTILSCLPSMVEEPSVGHSYCVLARYDNGICVSGNIDNITGYITLKIPYIENQLMNITTYVSEEVINDSGETKTVETVVYDKIDSLVKDSETSSITITYTKGITSGKTDSGIQYEETYRYYSGLRKKVFIDGIYEAELFYESIEDSLFEEEVYSDDYRLYRMAKMAKILGMEVGTTWTKDSAVSALLFTKDGYEGLQEEPKYDINLIYNRGNAAAWENHFKLSECNTMEDLENYGNNFFNL